MVREELGQRISIPTSVLVTIISFVVGAAGAWTGIQVGMQRVQGQIDQIIAVRDQQHSYLDKELTSLHVADRDLANKFEDCKTATNEKISNLRTDVEGLKQRTRS